MEFESYILALIDDMTDRASGDKLFTNEYLRGHLTLVITELESGDDHSAQAVYATVNRSLEKTTGTGELPPYDQTLAADMWEHLFQQASQQQVVMPGTPCLMRRLSRLIRSTGNAWAG